MPGQCSLVSLVLPLRSCDDSLRISISCILFVLTLLPFPSPCVGQTETEAWTLLRGIQEEFDRINDYSVDIKASLKVPGLSVPEMSVKMYFKKPDKVHVESESFAMLPRDAVMFHPSMFKPEEYDAVTQGTRDVRGTQCRKITLLAKSDTVRLQRVVLFIDPVRKQILRMEADPGEAASVTVDFTYIAVDGHTLPVTIAIEMRSPRMPRRPDMKPGSRKNGKAEKAFIRLSYANYAINKGISDKIFLKSEKKH